MHRVVILIAALAALPVDAGALGPARDRSTARDGAVSVERQRQRDGEGREQQTERTTRTLKLGPRGEIHLGNIAGDITISRGSGGDAALEIVKVARGRSAEDAKELLNLVQVDVTERGPRAEVKTRYPHDQEGRRHGRRNFDVSVSYNLTAPEGTRVSASSISGSVSVKDIKGDVALESVSGSVRIANAGRVAAAKSISGSVEIFDTQIDGALEASSVSGRVLVRGVKAHSVEAGAVSGDVLVQDVSCQRLEAQTVSGAVQFAGDLARGGRYELSSHSGDVKVTIAGNTGFEVEATSFSGSVRTDIPLQSDIDDEARGPRRRTVRGVHGDGSAILDLTTFSGGIVITRR
ncbi:MAG TPA: DUF4097 family beta strand repeat-containing protein [Vicinamibacterales bacterium]|nr:DUF4097 family beta strand repeat-containing protein [Vicinamibacterales bacterium]